MDTPGMDTAAVTETPAGIETVIARDLVSERWEGCEYAITNPLDPADWVGISSAHLAGRLPASERPQDADVDDDVVVYGYDGLEPAILDPSTIVWVREPGE